MGVSPHRDQFVNQIHVHQMANVSFKRTVNRFASVHLEWVVILPHLVVMAMNVVPTVIVQSIMRVWACDVEIHVPARVVLERNVKWKIIIQCVTVIMVWKVIHLSDASKAMISKDRPAGPHLVAREHSALF